ncbi:MAG TPA: ATP-binding cassette domain-containing protein [Bacilli bacterium]|nr:ATP-binding cassette domain-containing protein [Bacilli bacterium]
MLIKLVDIHKIYRTNNIGFHALKGINLELDRGEFVAILGPSGCGKTTLLNIIGGLDEPSSGDMVIDGKITTKFKDDEWDYFRNHKIGFVFQQYNLLDNLNIVENVALASKLQGITQHECMQKATDLLVQFGLKDHLHKTPKKLSGGQRQRVAIARALINNPDIIMADEPTGALDSKTSDEVMNLIKEISKDKLVIIVTHNKKIANSYADRVIRLDDGVITSDSKGESSSNQKVKVELKSKIEKTKFGFMDSFRLAFRNIMNRKWRTLLIALGLSIGLTGLLAIDTVGSGIRREIDAEQNQILRSPELFLEVEETSTNYYNPTPQQDMSSSYQKIKQLIPEIDEIYQYKRTSFIYSSKPLEQSTMTDIAMANNYKVVPSNIDYLGRSKELIEDGRMPISDTEVVISPNMARQLTKQYTLPVEQLWQIVKDQPIYFVDELKPDFDYRSNDPIHYNSCSIVYDIDNIDEVKYGTKEQNMQWALEIFGTPILMTKNYEIVVCTLEVYQNETYHVKANIDRYGWYEADKIVSMKAYTIVGVISSPQNAELYFTEEGVVYFNNKTFDYSSNSYVAYLFQNKINQKTSIITKLENAGIAVREQGNVNGEWQLLIKIITHIIQFGISLIVGVALITAIIMLIMVLYISILERKREIGLLRSLGATKTDIKNIFVSETAMIGLLAGIMSVIFTLVLMAFGDTLIYKHFGDVISSSFPYNDGTFLYLKVSSVINAIIGSIVIAILGGLIPASKAAKKPPIDALRR